jgi:ParB family chromosome partitioning protein
MQITETVIPLDFITGLSPFNVRQHDPSDDVSSLKATVRAVGLINPLVVHRGADNRFVVLAGGRRWRALCEIEAETSGAFWNIPAKMVDDASDAELIALSTMENTQTLAMHPVRQFEAFAAIAHALPSPEAAVEVIAKEFGLTRQQVRQRLALGDLSPKIRKAWLDGKIDAEAARAYAVSADIAAQEAFFEDSANQYRFADAWSIKKALLADWRNGARPEVLFVTEAAYRAAGGEVRESLFEEERLFNGALIDKLANEKLVAEGERLCTAEGWGFYTTPADDIDGNDQLGGFEPDFLPEEKPRYDALDTRIKRASGRDLAADAPGHECWDADFAELDAIEAKATMRALTAAQRSGLGVDVDFNHQGRLVILRAIQRASAESDEGEGDFSDDDSDDSPAPREKTPRAEQPSPLPPAEPIGKALRTVLDETLNAALQDVTGRSVNLALIYAVATLGCQCGGSILDLRLHARRGWTPRHELLKALAQLRFEKALPLAAAAPLNDLTTAFCELVGAAIDTARFDKIGAGLDLVRIAAPRGAIESALKQNFDPALYFHAATKSTAIDAIRETEGEASAADAQKLGKKDLTERAALTAKGHDWLPQVLREAVAASAAPAPDHIGDANKMVAPDTRTTIQAMQDALAANDVGALITITKGQSAGKSDALLAIKIHATEEAEPAPALCLADSVKTFIAAQCDQDKETRVKSSILLKAYNAWAAALNYPETDAIFMSATLEGLGYTKQRFSNGVHYLGFDLRSPANAEAAQ